MIGTEPDPREERLPRWAQTVINNLRLQAQDQAELLSSIEGAAGEPRNCLGHMKPASISHVHGGGYMTYPLVGDQVIFVFESGQEVQVSGTKHLGKDAILIRGIKRGSAEEYFRIVPEAANSIILT